MVEIDASRGTPIWALNRLREDALTQLLGDLQRQEDRGLPLPHCMRVKTALADLVSAATAIPDGGMFNRPIWKELDKFARIYAEWNEHEGTDPAFIERRKVELQRLREQRHRLARRVRKNAHILATNLDLQTTTAMYDALAGLIRDVPETFAGLAEAAARFARSA